MHKDAHHVNHLVHFFVLWFGAAMNENILKSLRLALGISQQAMSRELGIHPRAGYRLEHDAAVIKFDYVVTAVKLARSRGIKVDVERLFS